MPSRTRSSRHGGRCPGFPHHTALMRGCENPKSLANPRIATQKGPRPTRSGSPRQMMAMMIGGERDLAPTTSWSAASPGYRPEQCGAFVVLVYYLDLPLGGCRKAMGIPLGGHQLVPAQPSDQCTARRLSKADARRTRAHPGADRMMNDSFSVELRQHLLLATGDERRGEGTPRRDRRGRGRHGTAPPKGRAAAAVAARTKPFPSRAGARYGLIAAALLVVIVAAARPRRRRGF